MDFIDKKFLSRKTSADKTKLDNMFKGSCRRQKR